jgi:hypothetical protein
MDVRAVLGSEIRTSVTDPDLESSPPDPDPALVMYIYQVDNCYRKDVLNKFLEKTVMI